MVELEKFFELTSDLMGVASVEGRFRVVNAAFERVLGYASGEMCDRALLDLVHPDDRSDSQTHITQLLANQTSTSQISTVRFINRCACKDGKWRWLEWTISIVDTALYCVGHDITERVLAQKEIQQFNAELESRVTRRNQELEASQTRYLDLLKIEREGHVRAELAKATAQLYAEAVENMQVGLYVWQLTDLEDPASLTMVATNPAASEFTGIPMETVIGKKILEIFPALVDTDIPETYADVVKSKMMVDLGEVAYGDSRIEQSTFAVKAFPLTEACVGISFDDITKRKKTEATQLDQAAQLKILFDQAAVGMGRVSLEGQWIQVNQRLCELLGYSMPELLGKNYRTLTHPEDLKTSQIAYEQLINQKKPQVSYEKRYLTYEGDTLWAYVTVSTFHEAGLRGNGLHGNSLRETSVRKTGLSDIYSANNSANSSSDAIDDALAPLYFIVTVQDITERKRAITALKRQKNDLMMVNMMLTNTMSQLEQRNNELDQFAYVTSHDLKAPLRAIANLAGWIEEDLGNKLPPENKEQFDLLKSRVLRMEGFINGLLEYSRIGRTHQSSEIVDVAALLADIIDSISPLDQFSIETISPMPTIDAKRVPLIQVFSNLIGNAIKHHDRKDGRIEISAIEHDGSYEFLVADDGPGIDAAYHDKIFTIFQTLRSRDDLESTGIGLSLVKKTVEAEGGEISVRSEEGKGATFSFTWPKEPHVEMKAHEALTT